MLPSFGAVLTHAAQEALFPRIGGDPASVVQGGQTLRLRRALPPEATLSTTARVEGLYDLRRMAVAVIGTQTVDGAGEVLFEGEATYFFLRDGGFGGPLPPRGERVLPPAGAAPDFVVEQRVPEEQALLYRLNGDLNPLHADPAVAAAAEGVGSDRPILHGLCTYGYMVRALLAEVCGNDPARVRQVSARFATPVLPGETLRFEGWRDDDEPDLIVLRGRTLERLDEEVVTNASARVSPRSG